MNQDTLNKVTGETLRFGLYRSGEIAIEIEVLRVAFGAPPLCISVGFTEEGARVRVLGPTDRAPRDHQLHVDTSAFELPPERTTQREGGGVANCPGNGFASRRRPTSPFVHSR